ncbi:MAG: hypothetical protein E7593_03090 [Ruminococcaceae bacterium]|nr:hypothetical protein [Oscillospiraceae bacterium]
MRKFAKFLVPALLLVAVIVSCAVVFASADEGEQTVIYVYSTEAGRQRAPEGATVIGPGTVESDVTVTTTGGSNLGSKVITAGKTYAEAVDQINGYRGKGATKVTGITSIYKLNPLYKAIVALNGTTNGVIVLLDEVAIDVASQVGVNDRGDFDLGACTYKNLTITTTYDGVNYANSGAKLVLDHSVWHSTVVICSMNTDAHVKFDDLSVKYIYNDGSKNASYEEGFSFFANGRNFTVTDTVTVTSEKSDETAGSLYPNIFAGHAYSDRSGNPTITVNSGNWRGLYGAGHSLGGTNNQQGKLIGNSTITVGGTANVASIHGQGATRANARRYGWVSGNVTINVNDGTVGTIYGFSGKGIDDTKENDEYKFHLYVNIARGAEVGTVYYDQQVGANKPWAHPKSTLTYDQDSVTTLNTAGFSEIIKTNPYVMIDQVNATLDENVVLNFTFDVTEAADTALAEGKPVSYKLTIGDRVEEVVEVAASDIVNDKITVSAELYATEMTERVSVQFVVGEGSEEYKCDAVSTTFAGYAEQMLADSANAEFAEVVYATLNYGAMAQKKFDSEVADEDLANANVPEEFKGVISSAVAAPAQTASKTGSSTKLTYEKTTIVLFNQTVIRHYFTANTALTANEMEALGLVKSGSMYYYQTEGQDPTEYNTQPTVNVDGIVINYSVMNYLYAIDNSQSANVTDADKAVVRAMYDYYMAAVELTRS